MNRYNRRHDFEERCQPGSVGGAFRLGFIRAHEALRSDLFALFAGTNVDPVHATYLQNFPLLFWALLA